MASTWPSSAPPTPSTVAAASGFDAVVGQDRLHRGLSVGLEAKIDRRVDVQAALEQELGAVLAGRPEGRVVQEPLLDVLNEVGGWIAHFENRDVLDQHDRLVVGPVVLIGGDEAVEEHPLQHQVAPAPGVLRVAVGVEGAGALDQSGQQRGLLQR